MKIERVGRVMLKHNLLKYCAKLAPFSTELNVIFFKSINISDLITFHLFYVFQSPLFSVHSDHIVSSIERPVRGAKVLLFKLASKMARAL